MKTNLLNLVLGSFVLLTGSKAFAEQPILRCSTSGFALASLTIEQSSGTGIVKIEIEETEAGEEELSEYYVIQSGLNDVKARTSATVIAQEDGATEGGGALDKALLLRVLDGQSKAILAKDGVVYKLNCQK